MDRFVVVDAGARYGLHPTWKDVSYLGSFHLFEPEPEEAARLTRQAEVEENIQIHNVALGKRNERIELIIRKHEALSSRYELLEGGLTTDYMTREFEFGTSISVESFRLDGFFPSTPVHFLKLDVEGAELDVLEGATKLLDGSIQGVRSEVIFSPIYDGAPLFGDIDSFLRDHGFFLLNLDYRGRGSAKTAYTLHDGYGRLISTDAVWVKPNSTILQMAGGAESSSVALLRQTLFFLLNSATDYAVDTLVYATNLGLDWRTESDPLFLEVKRRLALLFKDLKYYPQISQTDLLATWQNLFEEPFPEMSNFWKEYGG